MKKIMFFPYFLVLCAVLITFSNTASENANSCCFNTAFTAGYVFKHDCRFKEVYGHGVVNAITGDICYYPWEVWGVGAKLSYWRAKGRTNFLKLRSIIQEVPVTLYARRIKDFNCCLQLYASLGGGFVWVKEKSYLGTAKAYKGIGEVEVGLNYPIWCCMNLTTAFRYLFPSQCYSGKKANVGGFDLRAGIGFSF